MEFCFLLGLSLVQNMHCSLNSSIQSLCLFFCPVLSGFSGVQLFATLWTVAHQAPLSMGFFRQEYWDGLPFPSPGDLPNPGIEPTSLISPTLARGSFTTRITWEVPLCEGPLSTPLGLVQWKRPHLEWRKEPQGSSPFLPVRRVPAALGQESQASSCVEEWNSACLTSCSWGDRPLLELYVENAGFPEHAWGCQCLFVLWLHPQGFLGRGVRTSGSYQDRKGNRSLWACGTTHEATSRISS